MNASPDLHAQAFEMVRKWWKAWVEKDLPTLESMADPEYSELTETRRLRPMGITRLMEEANRYCDDVSISDWDVSDPLTRVFEHNVVCSYSFRLTGQQGRRKFTYSGRATDVLARKDSAWVVLSHHGTFETVTETNAEGS